MTKTHSSDALSATLITAALPRGVGKTEFKKWFGKSKTVDEQGQPIVFFRGESSGSTHKVFDRKLTRENGFFFTTDEEVANIYAGKGNKARAFHLKAEKYIDLTHDTPKEWNFIKAWARRHGKEDFRNRETGEIEDPVSAVQGGRIFDWEGDWSSRLWKDLQRYAESKGYDAITLPDWDNNKGIIPATVVFKPENVRLLTAATKASPVGLPPLPHLPTSAMAPSPMSQENIHQP